MQTEKTIDSFSDSYQVKRVLRDNPTQEITFSDVRTTESGDICFVLTFNTEQFYVVPDSGQLLPFISFLLSRNVSTCEDILNTEVTARFGESLSEVTFGSETTVNIHDSKSVTLETGTAVAQQVNNLIQYVQQTNGETGWERQLQDLNKSKSSFSFTIPFGTNTPLEFELTDPENASIDNSSTRLIELVGGGDPSLLENEYVYIVHKSEVEQFMNTVTTDKTDEWVLVTPKDYNGWKTKSNSWLYKIDQETEFIENLAVITGAGFPALLLFNFISYTQISDSVEQDPDITMELFYEFVLPLDIVFIPIFLLSLTVLLFSYRKIRQIEQKYPD